jgi:hypothetical protein
MKISVNIEDVPDFFPFGFAEFEKKNILLALLRRERP